MLTIAFGARTRHRHTRNVFDTHSGRSQHDASKMIQTSGIRRHRSYRVHPILMWTLISLYCISDASAERAPLIEKSYQRAKYEKLFYGA